MLGSGCTMEVLENWLQVILVWEAKTPKIGRWRGREWTVKGRVIEPGREIRGEVRWQRNKGEGIRKQGWENNWGRWRRQEWRGVGEGWGGEGDQRRMRVTLGEGRVNDREGENWKREGREKEGGSRVREWGGGGTKGLRRRCGRWFEEERLMLRRREILWGGWLMA